MSSWAGIINRNNKNNKNIKEIKEVSNKEISDNEEENNNKLEDGIMANYKSLGYEDPEYEYYNKFGGDVIETHTNMQMYCEDGMLDIYDKKDSYIDFTDFVKKYSSAYHYFAENTVREYRQKFPNDENIENEFDST